jgi:hypothetical protein
VSTAVVCILSIVLVVVMGYLGKALIALIHNDGSHVSGGIDNVLIDVGFLLIILGVSISSAATYLHSQYQSWTAQNQVVTIATQLNPNHN